MENKGFSLLEILVSVAIFAIILLAVLSFFLSMNDSNSKSTSDRESGENARRVLDEIVYEIRSAESIYTPTTTQNQLSLKTFRYLPSGETYTYIDFFLCGSAICLKKESQNPIALTPDSVKVTSLAFSQISGGGLASPSLQVSLTVNSTSLTSTVSLRSY